MRYKVGDTFRFKGENPNNSYPNAVIVEIKKGNWDGPLEIWFTSAGPIGGRQWVDSAHFDDQTSDWYGIITSSRKEFTDEEYEELLV